MMNEQDILRRELEGSVQFYLRYTNLDPASPGYGLVVDSTKDPRLASIAAVGFALTAWTIASERGYLTRQEAREITCGTLRTLLHQVSHQRGFFAHFLDMNTGLRVKKCEFSTIDTALCLNGVITAEHYFQDAEITELAGALLERVDWNYIIFEQGDQTLFRMANNPDKTSRNPADPPGFIHRWDMAAEQKMMYLQAAGQIDPVVARELYHGFRRDRGYFEGQPIIINPGGNLFAYQFSEAWLDTERYLDPDGINWFNNTRLAALANRSFCIEHANRFKTYHRNSWGASCGDSPWGYDVSGASPSLQNIRPNGTVSIYSAIACLPYIPDLVLEMIHYLYHEQPQTWGSSFGFFDAYNLDVTPAWYSHHLYGIDKGCSMIMVENYLSRMVWETYTQSPLIQKALDILGFQHKGAA